QSGRPGGFHLHGRWLRRWLRPAHGQGRSDRRDHHADGRAWHRAEPGIPGDGSCGSRLLEGMARVHGDLTMSRASPPRSDDLLLRLRIEAFMADYVHCLDTDQLEAWPDFFTEDARYRVCTRENFDRRLPLSVMSC